MENKIPKLRFPEFTGEWEVKKLGEVGEVRMCKRIFNGQTQPFGEIPFFKIGSFGKEADAFISKELYDEYKRRFSFPKKGDILISAAGTIGRTVVYDGQDAYYQDSNIVWIDNDYKTISNEFLFYIYQIVKFNTEGGTIQRLYNNILKSTEFYSPTLPEQSKIANFLSSVDEKLQSLKKKKNLLQQYKKGMMQRLFCLNHDSENCLHHDSLDLQDEHDFNENQEKKSRQSSKSQKSRFRQLRFKDEQGNDFPDWEEKKLGEVAIKKSSNIAANKIEENIGNYIIYGASGILKYVDFYEEENDYISIIKDGAGVGRIFYCKGKSSVLGTMEIIKPKESINTYYLFCLLSNIDFVKYVTGSTIPHIYFKDYKNENCGIPCLNEQTKIAHFLSAIDDKINHCEKQIQQTELWKKGLLQKMFV